MSFEWKLKKNGLKKINISWKQKNAEKDKRDTEINKMQEQENRQRETETDSERDRKSERHTDKHRKKLQTCVFSTLA
jgi:hypothetical protein